MKNISLLFIAFLFLQFSSFAQQGWIEQIIGTGESLSAVSFTDSDNGTAVGITILRTTDGGINWISQGNPAIAGLHGVDFTDSNNGTAVGESGEILRTTDGGANWTLQTSGTPEDILRDVSFTDSDNGTAVGGQGIILRTTNGGVSFVEEEEIEEIPTDYTLSQNYPNPFNPSTKIKYQIPELSFVTIKVYDVLGNEIATLVNEEKQAGNYDVEFNSLSGEIRNLPSGIYFYRINVGDFIKVKKMVLLK